MDWKKIFLVLSLLFITACQGKTTSYDIAKGGLMGSVVIYFISAFTQFLWAYGLNRKTMKFKEYINYLWKYEKISVVLLIATFVMTLILSLGALLYVVVFGMAVALYTIILTHAWKNGKVRYFNRYIPITIFLFWIITMVVIIFAYKQGVDLEILFFLWYWPAQILFGR
ncbi:hypothetical protein GF345_04005 [Candidatus Woesearchaeota archaeon]|nr:hypothetical protein [Candidatus Woesearchaeota archaeon]